MRLALWDFAPSDYVAAGLQSGDALSQSVQIVRGSMREAEAMLRQGHVDVALVPTLRVLMDIGSFEVVPAVALSSWRYPYARIVLRGELGRSIESLSFDARYAQEVTLARIVLKEHYRAEPSFVPLPEVSRSELLARDEDATLLVGPDVPSLRDEQHYVMDLGQEWFELSNYPMVWGLFAMRRGEGAPHVVEQLRALVRSAEQNRRVWLRSQDMTESMHTFYHDDLRLRFDDLATASLTAFREYLFYYDVVDEVADLHVIEVPDEEDEGSADGGRQLRV